MECNAQERGFRSTWDTAGMMMSLLCLVHCVALPALLALLPAMHYHPDEGLHRLLTFLAVPIAAIALVPAYLKHRRFPVLALGMIGVVLLLGTHQHEGHHWVEHWPATIGALALVSAHAWNFRLSGCCYK